MHSRSGASYASEQSQAPPVNRHRPTVDVRLCSCANANVLIERVAIERDADAQVTLPCSEIVVEMSLPD